MMNSALFVSKRISFFMLLTIFCMPVSAYIIDGNLSDWGVTPFTDWTPDSLTVDWVEEDYNGTNPEPGLYDWGYDPFRGYPYGGEHSDIEALYFDDAIGVAYFAVVTSMGEDGWRDPWCRTTHTQGDLAIDLDRDPNTGEQGFEYGIKLTGPDKGQVCYMPDWQAPSSAWGFPENAPNIFTCDAANSAITGNASVAWADIGMNETALHPKSNQWGHPVYEEVPNYVIELSVAKAYIGSPSKSEMSDLYLTLSCGNDVIEIKPFSFDFPLPFFPEAAIPLGILLSAPFVAYLAARKS